MVIDRHALKVSLFLAILFVAILIFFDPGKFTGYLVQEEGNFIIVELNIPPEYERPYPGDTIIVETTILQRGANVEDTTPIDLVFSIKDLDGNVISKKDARSASATKLSSITSLLIPTTTKPGVYVAEVRVMLSDAKKNTVASKTFEIRKRPRKEGAEKDFVTIGGYILFMVIVLLTIIVLLYKFFRRGKAHHLERKTDTERMLKGIRKDIRKGVKKRVPLTLIRQNLRKEGYPSYLINYLIDKVRIKRKKKRKHILKRKKKIYIRKKPQVIRRKPEVQGKEGGKG